MSAVDLTTPNSKWQSVKLRLALLRIWFMKNIILWIQIFCIVCVVCMLTGRITAETPLLGKVIYPLFRPLIDEIQIIITTQDISTGLMGFFASVISILISVSMFTIKARSIAKEDIKSDKLKIAMIKAKLYFNADGKLVKRVETLTGADIDGDGKVDGEVVQNKGPITGLIQAIKELILISSVKLDGNKKENEESYNKALKDANLEKASVSLDELTEIVKDNGGLAVSEAVDEIMDTQMNEPVERKHARKNMFKRIHAWFAERKERREFMKKQKEEAIKKAEDEKPAVEEKPVVQINFASYKKPQNLAEYFNQKK